MVRMLLPLALALVAGCLPPKISPVAPKVDRARTIVLGDRLDVAGLLATELSHRGYAARAIAATESERTDLRPRIRALRAVITALPDGRSTGAGLGSAPLAIAEALRADVIVHTRRVAPAKLEVTIVDGRTGALVWRRAQDDREGTAATALAAMLPPSATNRQASAPAPRLGAS